MTPIVESLSLLTPYDIDLPKHRIGPNTDGGYIFAGELRPEQTVLSYGISTEYRFDEEMARRGHRVHMFDHTIEPLTPGNPNMIFHSEGVAGVSNQDARLFSIADHLDRNRIDGDALILKIDVEGAEYETFGSIDASVLRRFDQIVMEAHSLDCLADDAFRARFDAMFRKINDDFTLFHVHANNFDGDHLQTVGGLPVAGLIELSYIKTSRVKRTANMSLYPTDMDYPCLGDRKDKLLWFFPFLPTLLDANRFHMSDDRVDRLYRRLGRLKSKKDRHLDIDWYRAFYKDLADCTNQYLEEHFFLHGISEGRFGSSEELDEFDRGV